MLKKNDDGGMSGLTRKWYLYQDNKRYGPYDEAHLRKFIDEGRAKKDALVWCKGMAGWKKIAEIEPLKSRLAWPPTEVPREGEAKPPVPVIEKVTPGVEKRGKMKPLAAAIVVVAIIVAVGAYFVFNGASQEAPQVLTLSGSWYQIGFDYGKNIKESGYDLGSHIDWFINWWKSNGLTREDLIEIKENAQADYEEYLPWYVDYLEGLADGAGYDNANMLIWGMCAWRISGRLSLEESGNENWIPPEWLSSCTSALADGTTTSNNAALLGWNLEQSSWLRDSPGRFLVIDPPEGHSFALYGLFADQGGMFRSAVLNDAGLGVSVVGLPYVNDMGSGIIPIHIKLAIECSNVAEAIATIENTPCSWPLAFNIVDNAGDIAVVERGSGNYSAVFIENGYYFSTNRAMTSEMMQLQEMPFYWEDVLTKRYNFGMGVLNAQKGNITIEVIKEILSAKAGETKYGVTAKTDIRLDRTTSAGWKGVILSALIVPNELKYSYAVYPNLDEFVEVDLKKIFLTEIA